MSDRQPPATSFDPRTMTASLCDVVETLHGEFAGIVQRAGVEAPSVDAVLEAGPTITRLCDVVRQRTDPPVDPHVDLRRLVGAVMHGVVAKSSESLAYSWMEVAFEAADRLGAGPAVRAT
jgi:hypothetical protein